MIVIGVDPHKSSHTVTALEEVSHESAGTARFQATLAGYRQLHDWAGKFTSRRWAVENSAGLGRHLAQWLLARGETVVDVPATATARIRELSRGRRETDALDAAAAASVAATRGESTRVPVEDHSTILSMLQKSIWIKSVYLVSGTRQHGLDYFSDRGVSSRPSVAITWARTASASIGTVRKIVCGR